MKNLNQQQRKNVSGGHCVMPHSGNTQQTQLKVDETTDYETLTLRKKVKNN